MAQAQTMDSIRVFNAAGNSYYEVDSTAIHQELVNKNTQAGEALNDRATRDFAIQSKNKPKEHSFNLLIQPIIDPFNRAAGGAIALNF